MLTQPLAGLGLAANLSHLCSQLLRCFALAPSRRRALRPAALHCILSLHPCKLPFSRRTTRPRWIGGFGAAGRPPPVPAIQPSRAPLSSPGTAAAGRLTARIAVFGGRQACTAALRGRGWLPPPAGAAAAGAVYADAAAAVSGAILSPGAPLRGPLCGIDQARAVAALANCACTGATAWGCCPPAHPNRRFFHPWKACTHWSCRSRWKRFSLWFSPHNFGSLNDLL